MAANIVGYVKALNSDQKASSKLKRAGSTASYKIKWLMDWQNHLKWSCLKSWESLCFL